MKDLGTILKKAREKSGLSQGELAQKLGYSTAQFVSNWERGICSIPLKKVTAFCKFTGMSPDLMVKALTERATMNLVRRVSLRPSTSKKKKKTKPKEKDTSGADQTTGQ